MEVNRARWRFSRRLMELCGGLHGVPDNVGRRSGVYCMLPGLGVSEFESAFERSTF